MGGWERHSRQRGAWYARGNRNKYFRKGNISDLGEYERLEGRSGNEGRSQCRKPLTNTRLCGSLLFRVSREGEVNKGRGLLRLQQAGNKAKAETALGW